MVGHLLLSTHFTAEEIKAQSGSGTSPKSHSTTGPRSQDFLGANPANPQLVKKKKCYTQDRSF